MWIRIRAVIIEDEPLAAEYLTALLDDTCQVEIVGSATESEAGLRFCAKLRRDAVFLDINLPGKDGISLATQLAYAGDRFDLASRNFSMTLPSGMPSLEPFELCHSWTACRTVYP